MKILYIITKSNWGGAGRHVFDLATHISPSAEVVVALGGAGVLKDRLEEKGIRTVSISTLGRDIDFIKESSSFFSIYKIIKSERPDVIHLHSPKAAGLGALAGRLLGVKKIIYTVHGWTFNEDRNFVSRLLIKFFSWLTVLLCHTIIVLSPHEQKQTLALPFVSRKKIVLIPNGISPVHEVTREDARRFIEYTIGKPLPASTFIIGTIGELHKNKGHLYALQGFAALHKDFPHANVVIMGEGEERPTLEAYIKKEKLEGKVFLLGHVENASHYLKAFDVFLFPSLKEGLPYALLEAGEAAIPSVASDVGGISTIIRHLESGILIRPKNPLEIHNALIYCIEHREKTITMARELHRTIRSTFSLESMISETRKLYF